MDEIRLKLLQAELRSQMDRIEDVYEILEARAQHMAPGATPHVESTAYQLHNLYSAIEDLLQMVAAAFENSVNDLSRWHSQLIRRMVLEIPGVRPSLLASETAQLLQELRAFRHFFRHAYGTSLDYQRVLENLIRARELRPLLYRDVEQFVAQLIGPTPMG